MNIRELLIKIGVDAKGVPQAIDQIDNKTEKLKNNFAGLGTLLKTVFAAATIRELINMADGMQNLQSRVGAATGDLAGANAQLNDLNEHASKSRMSINDYADSWAKFQVGMGRLGYQTSDTTQLVDGLSAAFRVNGTAGATAAGALFQLTQSISGGMVQMEELNSLADAAGPLYVSIAEEIGGTTMAFKKMVSQGKVTSKMLADSIIKQTKKYIDQLREMPMTLGDVWTIVTNDVKVGINNLNSATSTISRTAKQLLVVWDYLKDRATALTDALGGPDGLLETIKNMITPLATVIGMFYAFKAFSFLASPTGMILMLAAAIGALYDDYQTWKAGGVSLIDWAAWEPGINAAKEAIQWLIDKLKELTGSTNGVETAFKTLLIALGAVAAFKFASMVATMAQGLASITIAAQTAGGAVSYLGVAVAGLARAAGIIGGVGALAYAYADTINEHSGSKAKLDSSGLYYNDSTLGRLIDRMRGRKPVEDSGPNTRDMLGNTKTDTEQPTPRGPLNNLLPNMPGGDSLPPGTRTTPAGPGNVQQTVNAPVNATINLTTQPGQSPQTIADNVVTSLQQLRNASGIGAQHLQDVNGDTK